MERKRIWSHAWRWIKILIGISLITWLLLRVDLMEVWQQLRAGNWPWMIPLIILFVGSLLLVAPVKLQVLVGGRSNYSFKSAFDASMIGLFFNNFFPTNIGGDVVKIQYLKSRGPLNWAQIITAILTERVTGLLVLAVAFFVYLLARPAWVAEQITITFPNIPDGYFVWIGVGLLFGLLLLSWIYRQRILSFLRQMVDQLRSYSAGDLGWAMFWSVVFHACRLLGLYCFLMFYGQSVDLFDLLFVLSFVAFISVLPISIGALGVRENAITWSLALFGVPVPVAVGLAIINRLLFITLSLTGGLIYIKNQVKIKSSESV